MIVTRAILLVQFINSLEIRQEHNVIIQGPETITELTSTALFNI